MTTSSEGSEWSVPVNRPKCDIDEPDTRKCQVCQGSWIFGQFFWATGKPGSNLDLAGIVCNRLAKLDPAKFEACANPCKGMEGGDTWEARMSFIDAFKDEL